MSHEIDDYTRNEYPQYGYLLEYFEELELGYEVRVNIPALKILID